MLEDNARKCWPTIEVDGCSRDIVTHSLAQRSQSRNSVLKRDSVKRLEAWQYGWPLIDQDLILLMVPVSDSTHG